MISEYMDDITSLTTEIEKKIPCDTSLGLFNGRMGWALFYFLQGSSCNNIYYTNRGKELFNEILNRTDEITDLGFNNGLIGIGWAVEWLKCNGFLIVNSDPILGALDDLIYDISFGSNVQFLDDIFAEEGLLNQLKYLTLRYNSINPGVQRFLMIAIEECLVYLTEKISDFLCSKENDLTLTTSLMDRRYEKYFECFAKLFSFFCDFHKLRLSTVKVQRLISSVDKFLHIALTDLSIGFLRGESNIKNGYLIETLSLHYIRNGRNFGMNYWCSFGLDTLSSLAEIPHTILKEGDLGFLQMRNRCLFNSLQLESSSLAALANPIEQLDLQWPLYNDIFDLRQVLSYIGLHQPLSTNHYELLWDI